MWRICLSTWLTLVSMHGLCWAQDVTLFNSDSKHPWNVCYKVLSNIGNTDLNDAKSLQKASDAVGTLLKSSVKTHPRLPIQRAAMQREAWRTFELLVDQLEFTEPPNRTLRYRLAKLISLTALSPREIGDLKTNYTTSPLGNKLPRDATNNLELPTDLFDPDGEWVQLTHRKINRVALTHESSHGGRSEFLLFLRFPEGKKQANAYVKKFNKYAAVEAERRREALFRLTPRRKPLPPLPEFPQGVRAILVERMLVISTSGIPKTTPIILSIAFNDLTPTISERTRTQHRLRSAVFEMSFEHLLDTSAITSLRRLKFGEPFFGEQHFPKGLQQCAQCHADNGLATLHSNFGGVVIPNDRGMLIVTNGSPSKTAQWKLRQPNYSVLLGYLEALSGADSNSQESQSR